MPDLFSADNLRQSFARLGLTCRDGLFDDLAAAYDEPERAYHTRQHVAHCLGQLDQHVSLCEHPGELAIAFWFHDAVYDPRAADNEEQSAAWAVRELALAGADGTVSRRVSDLVLATKHHQPTTPDERLMVDVDLAILGASPDVFDAYDQAIRTEYAWAPEATYRLERARVLRGFLERDRIYQTDAFRSQYEARARSNLARKLASDVGSVE